MERNYNLMTIQELTDICNDLALKFEQARTEMLECHKIMMETSLEVNKIKEIIEKRGGKL